MIVSGQNLNIIFLLREGEKDFPLKIDRNARKKIITAMCATS